MTKNGLKKSNLAAKRSPLNKNWDFFLGKLPKTAAGEGKFVVFLVWNWVKKAPKLGFFTEFWLLPPIQGGKNPGGRRNFGGKGGNWGRVDWQLREKPKSRDFSPKRRGKIPNPSPKSGGKGRENPPKITIWFLILLFLTKIWGFEGKREPWEHQNGGKNPNSPNFGGDNPKNPPLKTLPRSLGGIWPQKPQKWGVTPQKNPQKGVKSPPKKTKKGGFWLKKKTKKNKKGDFDPKKTTKGGQTKTPAKGEVTPNPPKEGRPQNPHKGGSGRKKNNKGEWS